MSLVLPWPEAGVSERGCLFVPYLSPTPKEALFPGNCTEANSEMGAPGHLESASLPLFHLSFRKALLT